ncbi:Hypothetical predicted protein [Scomber scombrus]|uniref:Uncharacterized protein n=1 Tax=Scomber scombrus TaxID=13677 RepID=A0AAV1NMZ6_SCOSC
MFLLNGRKEGTLSLKCRLMEQNECYISAKVILLGYYTLLDCCLNPDLNEEVARAVHPPPADRAPVSFHHLPSHSDGATEQTGPSLCSGDMEASGAPGPDGRHNDVGGQIFQLKGTKTQLTAAVLKLRHRHHL